MQPSFIRIPRRATHAWHELSTVIGARLSQRMGVPLDEIGPGPIVEELLRIGLHHVHAEGYPTPEELSRRGQRDRLRLAEMESLVEEVGRMQDRIIALEVSAQIRAAPDAGDGS